MTDRNLGIRRDNWIDPVIRDLELRDTEKEPGRGTDGNSVEAYFDCTKS